MVDTPAHGRETAVLFGDVPHEYLAEWDITDDFDLVRRKLAVEIEAVPMAELTARVDGLSEDERCRAADLARALIAGASERRPGQPDEEAIRRATRLFVAIREIAAERGAAAVTTICWPIRDACGAVPCVALTLLQDEGMPAACQGDIDALLTMVLFKRAAGLISFMGGGREEDGRLTVSHCVVSRRMRGAGTPLAPYYLGDYHGEFPSPTIHATLAPGQTVTVARLTKGLGALVLTKGALADCRDDADRCRNTLVIDVADAAGLMKRVRGIQQHLVVACGDHTAAMTRLADNAGIAVRRV